MHLSYFCMAGRKVATGKHTKWLFWCISEWQPYTFSPPMCGYNFAINQPPYPDLPNIQQRYNFFKGF